MRNRSTVQLSFWDDTTRVVNVASVPKRSPFRYPGGKTWLVPRIRQWLGSLPHPPKEFFEPFAGGGIISLTVAAERLADYVTMVELYDAVAAVWETIINDDGGGEWLADRIARFNLTIETARAEFAWIRDTDHSNEEYPSCEDERAIDWAQFELDQITPLWPLLFCSHGQSGRLCSASSQF